MCVSTENINIITKIEIKLRDNNTDSGNISQRNKL